MPQRPSRLILAAGAFFALLVLLCLYGSAKNFWAYSRMRPLPVEVLASSIHTDITPARELFHTLKLDLRSTDPGGRALHVEEELDKAYFPEEAYDTLALWPPGSRHTVHTLRGDAREVRLTGLQFSPERSSAFGLLFLAGFLSIFVLIFAAVIFDESPYFARIKAKRFIGAWTVFFGVGLLPLTGSLFFAWHTVPKLTSWPSVTATLVDPRPAPPPNTTVSPAAREYLSTATYTLYRFPWNGRQIHAGLGDPNAHYQETLALRCASNPTCTFKVDPADRWSVVTGTSWGDELFIPFAILFGFGAVFCGAGLLIRRAGL